jgi:hypothetical protein
MATKAAELYDEDFYAWTQQQAQALRMHFRGDNRLDVEHLAEEIEDLGKCDLHAVQSFVGNVIEHLLKLDYSGWVEARNHCEPDFVRRLPKTCPYDWHAVWHRDVLAEAGIDLSDGPGQVQKTRGRKRGA